MLAVLNDFIDLIDRREIEIYNEASLQFKLGWCLKTRFPNFKIELERNISRLDIDETHFNKSDLRKKEIDLLLINPSDQNKPKNTIIELKTSINQEQVRPVTVFDWIKDIRFLEQLSIEGCSCYSLFLTNNRGFLEGNRKTGKLLTDFRKRRVSGTYYKHKNATEKKDIISLEYTYNFEWTEISDGMYYFITKIGG